MSWFCKRSLVACTALVVAFWPVWLWAFERMKDRSDDPLGLIAVVAAVWFAVQARRVEAKPQPGGMLSQEQCLLIAGCLLAFMGTADILPMLVRAGFAMTAIAIALSALRFGKTLHLPTWGLMLLGLPVVATMQFYLGYPLRLLVTHVVAAVTACAGYAVQVSGTDLLWDGHVVGIDPACSGVKMLWTAFFVAFVFASMHKLSNRKTLLLCVVTLGTALSGNIFRAALLFMLEVGKSRMHMVEPAWLHAGIGVVLFAFVTGVVGWVSSRMATEQAAEIRLPAQAPRLQSSLIAACLLCALAPIAFPQRQMARAGAVPSQSMPITFEGKTLTAMPLTNQEKAFADGFPGQIGKFTDGKRQIVIRLVNEPTRQLHPAEDCFRGAGFKTHTKANFRDGQNATWGSFDATNEQMQLTVRERIYDRKGNSFADVSAWYWSSVFGNTHKPWVAITVAEKK